MRGVGCMTIFSMTPMMGRFISLSILRSFSTAASATFEGVVITRNSHRGMKRMMSRVSSPIPGGRSMMR